MNDLTKRQKEILDFLLDYLQEAGYPPTIREIGEAFHFRSNRGVVDHLRALERKGYIRRSRRSSRAIEILDRGRGDDVSHSDDNKTLTYPVTGRIEAGKPSPPVEDVDEILVLDRWLFGEPGDFILSVDGDSMIEDHIVPGDLLVVRRVQSCKNGEIVVAMVDGEATVKRFYRRGRRVTLRPANRRYDPVVFTGDDPRTCSILGRVIGVIRRLPPRNLPFSG